MSPAKPAPWTVVIAGTAGGVGTTTVAALLFAAFGTLEGPQLLDHSGGELGLRLTGGDDVLTVSTDVALHDLGAHALGRGIDRLDDPRALLIAVTASTPAGVAAAADLLAAVKERFGQTGLARTVVVTVGVFGRRRAAVGTEQVLETYGRRSVIPVPRDIALAGGGRIPANRLSAETRRAQQRLLSTVRERISARTKA